MAGIILVGTDYSYYDSGWLMSRRDIVSLGFQNPTKVRSGDTHLLVETSKRSLIEEKAQTERRSHQSAFQHCHPNPNSNTPKGHRKMVNAGYGEICCTVSRTFRPLQAWKQASKHARRQPSKVVSLNALIKITTPTKLTWTNKCV